MVAAPELTVNKMAEYMVKRAARQRKILHDRKYPDPEFNVGMYYREASEAVSKYLADGAVDPTPINKALQSLGQQPTDKVGTARRINSNIDALETFSEMLDDIDLDDVEPTLGAHKTPKLTYHNVTISVRPEIILRGSGPRGKKYVGAIKLHYSKTVPHTEESAGYVSAMVQEYCSRHIVEDDETLNPKYCQVIDVGSATIFPGVKSIKRRLQDVAAECQNIVAIWNNI